MAFRQNSASASTLNSAALEFNKNSTQAFVVGSVVAWNRSNNVLQQASSTTDSQSANCYVGVCNSDATAAETVCNVVPFEKNQIWEVDCNADTAASQVGARCRLTSNLLLDNQADRTTASDIFEIYKIVGSASTRKVLVRIVGSVGQVNA